MTYAEAKVIIDELRTRKPTSPFSTSEKREISRLYPLILGKPFRKTSCNQCHHDAVIEMALAIRKQDDMSKTIEKEIEEKACHYALRAGYLMHNPNFHNNRIFTNRNLTDEIAEEWLAMYPNTRKFFSVIPEKVEKPENIASNEPKGDEVVNYTPEPKKRSRRKKTKK